MRFALAVTAILPSLFMSVAFDRVLGNEDTRSLASHWIAANLPPDTSIILCAGYGAPPIPPGYPTRQVGFRLGAVREAEGAGYHHLVTHEHPALFRFSRIDQSLKRRLETAVLLERFDPFRDERRRGFYDELDAFYVPYAGLDSVERPGPVVSIWRLAP